MATELDSILSGKGAAAPAPETETNQTATAEVETKPAKTAEAEQPDGDDDSQATEVNGQKMVPLAALHGRQRKYKDNLAAVEQRLDEANRERQREREEWNGRFNQLLARFPAQQQQDPKGIEPPPDFFADPDAALNHRLSPFETKLNTVTQNLTLRASRAENVAAYGRDAVNAMEKAIAEAMASGDQDMGPLRAAMLQSDDPVGVAMSWHQRRSVLQEVGSDPAAYRQRLRDELKAELAAEAQQQGGTATVTAVGGSGGNGGANTTVMPSNLAGARNVGSRSGPAWSGPTPLGDIFKR